MITLTFPDGAKREIEKGLCAAQVAASISKSLEKKAVAAVVNGDPMVQGQLAVAFIPNYGVSLAECIPMKALPDLISLRNAALSGRGRIPVVFAKMKPSYSLSFSGVILAAMSASLNA